MSIEIRSELRDEPVYYSLEINGKEVDSYVLKGDRIGYIYDFELNEKYIRSIGL